MNQPSEKSHVAQQPNTQSKIKGKAKGRKAFTCLYCSETHSIFTCPKFLGLGTTECITFIRGKKLCENCFSSKYCTSACTNSNSCKQGGCDERHNTLLHRERRSVQSNSVQSLPDQFASKVEIPEKALCTFSNQAVLLETACIWLSNERGQSIQVHALIDQGSMRSFISKRVVSALALKPTPLDL